MYIDFFLVIAMSHMKPPCRARADAPQRALQNKMSVYQITHLESSPWPSTHLRLDRHCTDTGVAKPSEGTVIAKPTANNAKQSIHVAPFPSSPPNPRNRYM